MISADPASSVPASSRFPEIASWSVLGDPDNPPKGRDLQNPPAHREVLENCILVVDDEPEALDAVVELFEGEGLTTMRARHGQEALDLIRSAGRPSMILLDLKMPVMDGWEFCRQLAADEEMADIPIAIVTATASVDHLPERRTDAGFFRKPVDFDRLLKVVKRFCG
ncbi:MAG TPA: response regulator [Thermoanaerobaculia bacterium]|jgi:CheY-like chemotaxis protein|nr:response regulator [Thermoanaerobaculia bacterium]